MEGNGGCRDAECQFASVKGDKSHEKRGRADSWWEGNEQREQETCERKGYLKEASQMSNTWPGQKIPHISLATVPPVKLHCHGMDCATGTACERVTACQWSAVCPQKWQRLSTPFSSWHNAAFLMTRMWSALGFQRHRSCRNKSTSRESSAHTVAALTQKTDASRLYEESLRFGF